MNNTLPRWSRFLGSHRSNSSSGAECAANIGIRKVRNTLCNNVWSGELNFTVGSWKGSVPIPGRSFEFSQEILDDRSQIFFKQFIGRALQWLPEERPTAEELAFAEFLMQHIEHEKLS